jgi:sugar lactone lactonase YvrE
VAPKIERLTAPICSVGESPVWRAEERALYWVDIPARHVHRLRPASGEVTTWTADEMVACIAFDSAGDLVAGMESGVFRLSLTAGGDALGERLAAVEHALPNMRFNDGRCDRQGRFWAGTMHMDMSAGHAVGALYRYDGGNALAGPFGSDLLTQNGLAWSPDGRVMYLSDSHPRARKVWAFDYDAGTGAPSSRRLFVDMNLHPGRPDGAAVDVDGCYWTCANDAGRLLRFTPAGRLDREVPLPAAKPSMCAFGGEGLDTLFVTTIRPASAAEPDAGAVFALRPGVQGIAETPFEKGRRP